MTNDIQSLLANTFDETMTAYHEASHTIYGLLHYLMIETVFIYFDENTKRAVGFTYYLNAELEAIGDDQLFLYLITNEISLKYAGLIGEKIHFKNFCGKEKFPRFLKDGSEEDTNSAAKLIRDFELAPMGKNRIKYKKKLKKQIEKELKENWSSVILIANTLLVKKKLSYSNLKNILTTKSKNKCFWKKKFKIIDDIFLCEDMEEDQLKSILGI